MSLNLSELPTEVLTNIFSYTLLKCIHVDYADPIETSVWTKQLDLYALCLTNRRISGIAREILLERVWLVPGGEFSDMQNSEFDGYHRTGFKDRTSSF